VKAGVAIGTISFAERDQRYPDPIRRMAIAKALGVEPEQIWPEETAA
jgi:lambda repressor-like predicted transcriptional regulator